MGINITDKALTELKKLNIDADSYLRITVIPGGCSGMTYSAAIDNEKKDEDEILFDNDGLRVIAEGGTLIFLEDFEIDYSDDLIRSGFRFKNPNASGSCGCGSSFAG